MSAPANSVAQVSDSGPAANQELQLWFECYQFLALEAELLDEDRPAEWLELLTADINYEMPIRMTRRRGEDPIAQVGWHMKEDFGSLKTRIARLQTSSAWGEDPPTRTRRLISNLRCTRVDADALDVKSNLLLYLGRGDAPEHTVLAAERRDRLRRTENGLRLAQRIVLLSHATLPVQSIGVFI